MVISLIAHFTLVRSPLYCSVILFKDQKDVVDTTEETEPLISGEALGNSNRDDAEDDQAFLSKHRRMGASQLLKDYSTITWKIVQANVLYKTSICSIYLVTLVRLFYLLPIECSLSVGHGNQSVFPPIIATILSVNASRIVFFSLSPALVIFNIANYISRATASPAHLPGWNQSPIDAKLFIASVGRIPFVPLLLDLEHQRLVPAIVPTHRLGHWLPTHPLTVLDIEWISYERCDDGRIFSRVQLSVTQPYHLIQEVKLGTDIWW